MFKKIVQQLVCSLHRLLW